MKSIRTNIYPAPDSINMGYDGSLSIHYYDAFDFATFVRIYRPKVTATGNVTFGQTGNMTVLGPNIPKATLLWMGNIPMLGYDTQ